MANSRTKARIEARIRQRVAYCVQFELNDPRSAFITITRAEVSSDLSTAKVFYSVYGTAGDRTRTECMLADATGFIRKQLSRVLRTRRIPRLTWIYDDTIEFQEKMEATISRALDRDREVNPAAHPERNPAPDAEPSEEEVLDREYLDFLETQEREE
ncbi:MAG: 30S ribosome-binding factor RbfA [Planctomycetota bacterium]